jgi:peptidyl-prolyl cis-trans isomerase SurA
MHLSLAKQFFYPVFLALVMLAGNTQAAPEIAKMDRIVAIVDQVVITEKELQDKIRVVSAQLEKKGVQLPPQDVLERQILERLINDSLQLQFAQQTGLRVDDIQLDKTIERIAEQNRMDVAQFRQTLEEEGISFRSFREDIRNEILLARLREREVDNRINVTEAEIDNFLITQSSRQDETQDEYEVSHILIRAPEEGSPEELQQLRAKAEQALKQVQGGTSFSEVSARMSDAPSCLHYSSMH